MSTDINDILDPVDESLDDTLDGDESLESWVIRRTCSSLTGMLTADDAAAVYSEETGRDVPTTTQR